MSRASATARRVSLSAISRCPYDVGTSERALVKYLPLEEDSPVAATESGNGLARAVQARAEIVQVNAYRSDWSCSVK